MQNLMVVESSELVKPEPVGLQIASAVMQPFPQMEAAVVNELDRVTALADRDPLESLAQTLRLMQELDIEILKCMAPALIESAQHDATSFAAGKTAKPSTNGQQLASMVRLQKGIAELGMARVKVRDEQDRLAGHRMLPA